jgi:hypothetical protein
LQSSEIADVPILVLGNKIDNQTAVNEEQLRRILGLQMTSGKNAGKNITGRPLELFMCSMGRKVGYGEGSLDLSDAFILDCDLSRFLRQDSFGFLSICNKAIDIVHIYLLTVVIRVVVLLYWFFVFFPFFFFFCFVAWKARCCDLSGEGRTSAELLRAAASRYHSIRASPGEDPRQKLPLNPCNQNRRAILRKA